MKKRKGQMVFEFMVAAVFFLAIIMYVINQLNTTVYLYGNEYRMNTLESRAMEISEILVKNPGVWDNQTPISPGLAVEWPVLNQTRIGWMDSYCRTNYTELAKTMGVGPDLYGFRIEVAEDEGNLMECGQLARGRINAMVERVVLSESGELLSVVVWTW
jgi:hypothetical protein